MKSLTINRDSWHFRLAKFGGLWVPHESTDLCTYFWRLVWGALKFTGAFILVCAALTVCVVLPLVQVVGWLTTGVWLWDWIGFQIMVGYLILATIIGGAAGCVWLQEYASKKRHERWMRQASGETNPPREPSPIGRLIAAGYRSWKEKTCVLVEVKD